MIIPYQRSKVQPETERGIAEARLVKEKSATRGTLCRRECSYTGTENIGRRIEHKHMSVLPTSGYQKGGDT